MHRVLITIIIILITVCMTSGQESNHPTLNQNSILKITDFEDGGSDWTYYGGYEFKGAKGSQVIDTEVSYSGKSALHLDADFSKGGSYISTIKKYLAPAVSLRFWVKAPGQTALDLRLKDASDQTFRQPKNTVQISLQNVPPLFI